jgi:hypothetical protein
MLLLLYCNVLADSFRGIQAFGYDPYGTTPHTLASCLEARPTRTNLATDTFVHPYTLYYDSLSCETKSEPEDPTHLSAENSPNHVGQEERHFALHTG